MATEALRRLREEINAAFETPRQSQNERIAMASSSEKLAPKWAQVTALLASLSHQPAQKTTHEDIFTPLRLSRSFHEGKRLKLVTAKERQVLLRDVLDEWRCVAHKAAVVTRLVARVRKRRHQRLVAMGLEQWKHSVMYQWRVKTVAKVVKKDVRFRKVRNVWRQWTSAQDHSLKVKEFRQLRRKRLKRQALRAWVLAASQHVDYRRLKQRAARQVLRHYWRCLKAGIETQQAVRRQVECLVMRRMANVMKAFFVYVQRMLKQKAALATVLDGQQRRRAFTQLVVNMRSDQKRERLLKCYKMHRIVWTWFHHSFQSQSLRLRAEFVRKNHEYVVLRAAAWKPWRHAYLFSSALRKLKAKQRAKQLKSSWTAFTDVFNRQKQLQLLIACVADAQKKPRLRRTINVWYKRAMSWRKSKELTAKSATFSRLRVLQTTMLRWQTAHQIRRKEKYLDRTALRHITSKMVQHWARWTYWSKRELGRRILAVRNQRHKCLLLTSVDYWRRIVVARHNALCSKMFNAWRVGIYIQHRTRASLRMRRLIHLRWRWQRWKLLVVHCQVMRAKAKKAQELREQRLMRNLLVERWLQKTRRYKVASNAFTVFINRYTLTCALSQWRHNQVHYSAKRLAIAFRGKKLQRHYLRLLFASTVGPYRIAIAIARRRQLVRVWTSWSQYFMLRRQRNDADAHWRQCRQQKAIRYLRLAATDSITRRTQRFHAVAWHEAVLVQSVLSQWLQVVKHVQHCRLLGRGLTWHTIGRRAFRTWHNARMEKQKLREADNFHSLVLITRTWNALVRVTKRRQLALAMWNHTAKKFRLSHVLRMWKNLVDCRRGQYAVAASMYRMQEQHTKHKFWTAWSFLAMARAMAWRREQQHCVHWRHKCWIRLRLWRVSRRWQRSQQRLLLQVTFRQGLRRYAIQQQACREICLQMTQNVLHRSLLRWRIEFWLLRSQNKLSTGVKRRALSQWKTCTAASHQKRQWRCYIQQLHRSQMQSKPVMPREKRHTGDIFRDTRALQARLKRDRILMTHVIHAWYLVVQTRDRRMQNSLPDTIAGVSTVSSTTAS